MNFICKDCKNHDHDSCKGDTWCDYQHKQVFNGE